MHLSGRFRRLSPWLLVIAVGTWAYYNSVHAAFIFDDQESILENPSIRRLDVGALRPPPESPMAGRPLVNLSFAINYALGGLDPRGYHLANRLIHLACALLVLSLFRRTLRAPPMQPRVGDSADALALCACLIWTTHPLLTESVMYVTQRTELLMAFCFLLTLYAVIQSATRPGWRASAWKIVAVAACALGMGAKEVMAMAVPVAWLYDGSRRVDRVLPAGDRVALRFVAGAQQPGSGAGASTAMGSSGGRISGGAQVAPTRR